MRGDRDMLEGELSNGADEEPAFCVASYLHGILPQIAICIVCILMVGLMARVQGVSLYGTTAICGFMIFCMIVVLASNYVRKARFYHDLDDLTVGLDDVCMASFLIKEPAFTEGKSAFAAVAKLSSTAAMQLDAAERDLLEYRQYVETWIHEIKTPIAAAKLVLANMHGDAADKLGLEIERIEFQVEQALYYARSSSLASDYSIRELLLADACRDSCKRNSRYLIERQCIPSIDVSEETCTLADKQWLGFMLSQVVVNSAQYGAKHIRFSSHDENSGTPGGCTVLEVADDGYGIPAADLPRVFDRGFTGVNGRNSGKATGFGLYLVARLAESMGIGVSIASEVGKGTRVLFSFPHDRSRAAAMTNLSEANG